MTPSATATTGKTTFTTPSDRELVATRTFDAPRDRLWKAHTDPRHVKQWMTGPDGHSMPTAEIDLRPGGRWHFVWRQPDGQPMEMDGEYKEIVPNERLVNTERWAGFPETLVTTTFVEKNGTTTLAVNVRYPSKEAREKAIGTGMKEGWSASYDHLDSYLREMK